MSTSPSASASGYNYFVTGTNRGIGLELTRQLVSRNDVSRIWATTRGPPSAGLAALLASSSGAEKIVHLDCDVTVPASLEAAVARLRADLDTNGGGGGVDVLVNNVGAQSPSVPSIEALDDDTLKTLFDVNVLAAHRVTKAILPFLRKGRAKKIINITTTLGSIAIAETFSVVPTPAYKITKAALNMLTVQYALELGKDGFTVAALSPGNIKTDLGGGDGADLTIEEGVKATLDVILAATPQQNGKFLNVHVPGWENAERASRYDGAEVPW